MVRHWEFTMPQTAPQLYPIVASRERILSELKKTRGAGIGTRLSVHIRRTWSRLDRHFHIQTPRSRRIGKEIRLSDVAQSDMEWGLETCEGGSSHYRPRLRHTDFGLCSFPLPTPPPKVSTKCLHLYVCTIGYLLPWGTRMFNQIFFGIDQRSGWHFRQRRNWIGVIQPKEARQSTETDGVYYSDDVFQEAQQVNMWKGG